MTRIKLVSKKSTRKTLVSKYKENIYIFIGFKSIKALVVLVRYECH